MKKQLQTSNLKLVVTDDPDPTPVQDLPAPATDSSQTDSPDATKGGSNEVMPSTTTELQMVDINEVDKLMTEVPLDDFFKALEAATPAQLQSLVGTLEKNAKSKEGSNFWTKLLGVSASGHRSMLAVVWWWEVRRSFYNLCVGLVGLPFALLVGMMLYAVPNITTELIAGIVFYGIAANVCYSLGAPAELVARACWKNKGEPYGPVLFTLGLIFSVMLTIGLGLLTVLFILSGWITFHPI